MAKKWQKRLFRSTEQPLANVTYTSRPVGVNAFQIYEADRALGPVVDALESSAILHWLRAVEDN